MDDGKYRQLKEMHLLFGVERKSCIPYFLFFCLLLQERLQKNEGMNDVRKKENK
jgi:hypothetical protein